MTLSEYLKNRGLNLDYNEIEFSSLSVEQKQMIAGIDKRALTLLLQERINQIGNEILVTAVPEEVMVLRQSIVELTSIITDYIKIQEDVKRMKDTEAPQPSPPEEGKEGAL